jgi:hypothetical protein
MFESNDIVVRLEFCFPQLVPPISSVPERKEYLCTSLALDIRVKEIKGHNLSFLAPNFIFGPSVDSFHPPLRSSTSFLKDLELLSSTPEIVLGFKGPSKLMPRYNVPSTSFSNLLARLEKRFNEIANLNHLWGLESTAVFDRPPISTDCEFLSNYILVGNIDPFHP